MLKDFIALLDDHFGRCMYCMRQAFLAALLCWALALGLIAIAGESWVAIVPLVVAIGATALWLAHVAVFAFRTLGAEPAQSTAEDMPRTSMESFSRRQFAARFIRLAAATAAATAFVAQADSAFAACDCSKCSSSQNCCRTANGQCGCFPKAIRC